MSVSHSASIEVLASSCGPTLRVAARVDSADCLADQLRAAGLALNLRCGGRGLCAGCTVRLLRGQVVGAQGVVVRAPAEVLACQFQSTDDTTVVLDVPARSRLAHEPHIATTFKVLVPSASQPIIAPRPGADLGLAVDIGTTTVMVLLVDLATGQILEEAADFNRQVEFGDDVLTRIQAAGRPNRRRLLQEAITVRTLSPLIARVCRQAGRSAAHVAVATVAGNTAMLHLLADEDPTSLGVAPFTAAFLASRRLTTAELGLITPPLDLNEDTWLRADVSWHLLPGFSAYVGADLLAGYICTGLAYSAGPSLLIDIGTNGEILLKHEGHLLGCATAAGPAFEGGRLSAGTRAGVGAVNHVRLAAGRGGFELECIPGSVAKIGLCGSAYVDFLATAREAGWLTPTGRFAKTLPPDALTGLDPHRAWQLAPGDPASAICEADVAQLLQAKAAIAAGLLTLLRHAGLAPADVRRLYLAGGFGLHLDLDHSIACGLLPGFRPEQIEVVGNTALGGAWLALTDRTVWPGMTDATQRMKIVELNLEPDFEDTFIDQLTLP